MNTMPENAYINAEGLKVINEHFKNEIKEITKKSTEEHLSAEEINNILYGE